MDNEYPVKYSVYYGDGTRNRLTTAFRLILIIPVIIVAALLTVTNNYLVFLVEDAAPSTITIPSLALGIGLMILFRQKYPRWVFNFMLEATRFGARVGAYLGLLVDDYPSTDEEQSVYLDITYPDVEADLTRWMPLVKWLLAIPHYICLIALAFVAIILTIIAWFAIIITGKYPKGMFDFVVGVGRWGYRVLAYAFLLTTDRYPPFRLSP